MAVNCALDLTSRHCSVGLLVGALVDVQLPDTDGLALAQALAEADSGLRTILTSTDRTLVPAAALAASPALAFVPKDELGVANLAAWIGG